MASIISSGIPVRNPCDYNENYLKKLKEQKDILYKTIKPQDMNRFQALFDAFSRYHESGLIMLAYRSMAPAHAMHQKKMEQINCDALLEFNDEVTQLKNFLTLDQTWICNDILQSIMRG